MEYSVWEFTGGGQFSSGEFDGWEFSRGGIFLIPFDICVSTFFERVLSDYSRNILQVFYEIQFHKELHVVILIFKKANVKSLKVIYFFSTLVFFA